MNLKEERLIPYETTIIRVLDYCVMNEDWMSSERILEYLMLSKDRIDLIVSKVCKKKWLVQGFFSGSEKDQKD